MAIRELYGVRITDRVTVELDTAAGHYVARFDGEVVARNYTPKGAAMGAANWLRERQKKREAEAAEQTAREAAEKARDDSEFVENIAERLGVDSDDLRRLVHILSRD